MVAGDPYAVIARIDDVRLVPQAPQRPGPVSIARGNPVHVEIENGSDTELLLGCAACALVADDGRR
jgi:hypothetical protein